MLFLPPELTRIRKDYIAFFCVKGILHANCPKISRTERTINVYHEILSVEFAVEIFILQSSYALLTAEVKRLRVHKKARFTSRAK